MSKHSWRVYCLDLKTGRILWERTAHEGVPRTKRDVSASYANPTPATDGRYIVAFFGSEGLYGYKLDGTLVWKKDLGVLDAGYTPDPESHWGFASSPVIFRDVVIVQCDRKTNSFLAAFRLSDGAEVWRTPRAEDSSWSTPVIYDGGRRVELLASGTNYYRGYDPLTGRELWRLKGGIDVKIPTPVASEEFFFFTGGQGTSPQHLRAVRAGVSGDITPPGDETTTAAIAWTSRGGWTILTPLVYHGLLYVGNTGGVLTVYDARTGEQVYRERLGSGAAFAASPVAADGRVYFTSQDGDVYVIKAGPSYELLAMNPVDELVMATPAIADSMLIVRGLHHVFAFRERAR